MSSTPSTLRRQSTYHGQHQYSTFSASLIKVETAGSFCSDSDSGCCCWCQSRSSSVDSTTGSPLHSRPRRGGGCCRCTFWRWYRSLILHPVGPFRCGWDMIVMVLLIWTSIEIPFTLAFGSVSEMEYVSLFVDCCLMMDIVLNFHTAYFDKYDNLRLVTHRGYICRLRSPLISHSKKNNSFQSG